MRKTKNDSSYFSGDIEIKFWINRFGTIDDVLIVRSTTKNSLFDKVVTECIAKWKFPKSNGFSFGHIILRFKRTGYSGKSMDMEKMEYPIPGGAASEKTVKQGNSMLPFLKDRLSDYDANLFIDELMDASMLLGTLDAKVRFYKFNEVLLPMFHSKEAIASMYIEGTQTTVSDVFENNLTAKVLDDKIHAEYANHLVWQGRF